MIVIKQKGQSYHFNINGNVRRNHGGTRRKSL